ARHEHVARFDLVAGVDHLDLAGVARGIARSAYETPRVREHVLDIDPKLRVDGELQVDRIGRDPDDRADNAVGRNYRHVRSDLVRAPVEHHARHAEEWRHLFADDHRAYGVAGRLLAELQEPPEPLIVDLLALELVDLLAQPRVVVGEPVIVG